MYLWAPVTTVSYVMLNFIRLSSNVDAGGSGGTWTCTCAADGFPKVASNNVDTNCFTACNCTSGMLICPLFFLLKSLQNLNNSIVKLLLCYEYD